MTMRASLARLAAARSLELHLFVVWHFGLGTAFPRVSPAGRESAQETHGHRASDEAQDG